MLGIRSGKASTSGASTCGVSFVGSASSSHPNRSSMCSRCFLRIDICIYICNKHKLCIERRFWARRQGKTKEANPTEVCRPQSCCRCLRHHSRFRATPNLAGHDGICWTIEPTSGIERNIRRSKYSHDLASDCR